MANYKIKDGSLKWNGSFVSMMVSFNGADDQYYEIPSNDKEEIHKKLSELATSTAEVKDKGEAPALEVGKVVEAFSKLDKGK